MWEMERICDITQINTYMFTERVALTGAGGVVVVGGDGSAVHADALSAVTFSCALTFSCAYTWDK